MTPNYGSIETADFDTSEFIAGRTALGLDALGIAVVASEWGDTEQEVFYIRQELGEVPAERHPPNRTIILKLQLKEDKVHGVKLAEAVYKLQQKIALLQQEGGWLRRTFSSRNSAKTAVGFEVYAAVMTGIQGWVLGHRNMANEVTLTLTCSPYCYGTEEIEGTTVVSSNGRDREFEIGTVKGTAPGLLRLKIKNTGTEAWSGFLGSIESRDHKSGTSALLSYEAVKLTFTGGTEVEKEGVKTVKRTLAAEWQTILQGKITSGAADMNHIGGRRMLIRVYNEAQKADGTRFRLEWRALNGQWQTNEEVEATILNGWMILDVGEAILEKAVYGEQAWEWKLQVRSADHISGNEYVYIHKVYPLAQEQFFSLRKSYLSRIPPTYFINGERATGALGEALNGKEMLAGGGKWETSGSANGDWLTSGGGSTGVAHRSPTAADTEFRKAFVSAPTKSNVFIQTTWTGGYWTGASKTREYGIYAHGENIKCAIVQVTDATGNNSNWYLEVSGAHVVASKKVELIPGSKNSAFSPNLFTVSIVGKKMVVYVKMYLSWVTELSFELNSTAEGKVGLFDKCPWTGNYIACEQFLVFEPEIDTLLSPGRLMNLSSNGAFVQHPTLERWGEIPLHSGFLPDAAPSYLEARPLCGILIPSNGDLEALGDPGTTALEATPFYRPAYAFMSEAG